MESNGGLDPELRRPEGRKDESHSPPAAYREARQAAWRATAAALKNPASPKGEWLINGIGRVEDGLL